MSLISFEIIRERAMARKGGEGPLNALLATPKTPDEVRAIPSDRWLARMTRSIFQAGFNWKVVDAMWPGFEEAFDGFAVGRCAMLSDEDLDRLVSDTRIVRHGTKIRSVIANASFLIDIAEEHGSVGAFFADWPVEDHIGLLEVLKKRGSRLGGATSSYFLRFMGVDGFIMSRDGTQALMDAGVIDKPGTSKKTMRAVQDAYNSWREETGLSLTEMSGILAMSTGENRS